MKTTSATSEHRAKYGAYVAKLGRDRLARLLPSVSHKWGELLAKDEHLNNVPLHRWDAGDSGVRALVRAAGGSAALGEAGGWSLCNSVCVLKETARQLAEMGL
jgi:hypothetical protein